LRNRLCIVCLDRRLIGGMAMTIDRKFLICGFAYAIAGMGLGIYMAASKNHALFVAHAHILLVGFVVSFVYALVHKLWIVGANRRLASVQFYLHQVATLVMVVGLVLLYAGIAPEATLGSTLGLASVGVLLATVLIVWMILRLPREQPTAIRQGVSSAD
jgi:hypothetical protein